MNKERAIYFAGLMEEYLDIPSCVCESIENELINEKYNKVINYVIDRRKELENKEDYKSYQDIINTYFTLQQENKQLKEMIDEQDGCNKRRLQIFELKDKLCELQQENKQLKEKCEFEIKCNIEFADRIDKAIDYTEEFYDSNQEIIDEFSFEYSYKHIIEILKGE